MAATYSITGQRQTQQITADGRIQDVMEITFLTNTGVTATVRVPLAMYTAENVANTIDAFVTNIDAVSGL